MLPDPSFVAARHLSASSQALIKTVKDALAHTTERFEELTFQANLMDRLIARGEARRLGRTSHIQVKSANYDGSKIVARIQGTTDDYSVRISLKPKPGHFCECRDWQQRGRQIGPCKHVLRLGEYWMEERVEPELKLLADSLIPF